MQTNLKTYRLATKTKTGDVIAFGPVMSMPVANRKRAELDRLTPESVSVYVINTLAQ